MEEVEGCGSESKYILWDWNGTLLDDIDAEVAALNMSLGKRGLGLITKEFFRENFAFPARTFYRLVGMDVPDDEWDLLAKEYHDNYHTFAPKLAVDAIAALELAKAKLCGQSIISALHQEFLNRETAALGVRDFMDRVYGVDNLDGGSKVERAKELAEKIRAERGRDVRMVLIGDSIHDRDVAESIGADCILYSGGSHSRSRLEKCGTVADSLVEAVETWVGRA